MGSSHGIPLEECIATVLRTCPLVTLSLVGEKFVVLTAHVGELTKHISLDVAILHDVLEDCTGDGLLVVELLLDAAFKLRTHRHLQLPGHLLSVDSLILLN